MRGPTLSCWIPKRHNKVWACVCVHMCERVFTCFIIVALLFTVKVRAIMEYVVKERIGYFKSSRHSDQIKHLVLLQIKSLFKAAFFIYGPASFVSFCFIICKGMEYFYLKMLC